MRPPYERCERYMISSIHDVDILTYRRDPQKKWKDLVQHIKSQKWYEQGKPWKIVLDTEVNIRLRLLEEENKDLKGREEKLKDRVKEQQETLERIIKNIEDLQEEFKTLKEDVKEAKKPSDYKRSESMYS